MSINRNISLKADYGLLFLWLSILQTSGSTEKLELALPEWNLLKWVLFEVFPDQHINIFESTERFLSLRFLVQGSVVLFGALLMWTVILFSWLGYSSCNMMSACKYDDILHSLNAAFPALAFREFSFSPGALTFHPLLHPLWSTFHSFYPSQCIFFLYYLPFPPPTIHCRLLLEPGSSNPPSSSLLCSLLLWPW